MSMAPSVTAGLAVLFLALLIAGAVELWAGKHGAVAVRRLLGVPVTEPLG